MKPTTPLELLCLFGIPGMGLIVATRVAIPLLAAQTTMPLEVCWFLSAERAPIDASAPAAYAQSIDARGRIRRRSVSAAKRNEPISWPASPVDVHGGEQPLPPGERLGSHCMSLAG